MFEDDWPGVFIRGDDAFRHSLPLRQAITLLEDIARAHKLPHAHLVVQLKGLLGDLQSCILPMPDQSVIQKIWRGDPPPEPLESQGPSDYIARQEPKE